MCSLVLRPRRRAHRRESRESTREKERRGEDVGHVERRVSAQFGHAQLVRRDGGGDGRVGRRLGDTVAQLSQRAKQPSRADQKRVGACRGMDMHCAQWK
eukprot:6188404-Pleurochrysis_carterae.AAC.1